MARKCTRFKYVRIKRGPQKGKRVKRCANFAGLSRGRSRGRSLAGLRSTKGKSCTRYKRVRTKSGKYVRRCANFSGVRSRGKLGRVRGGRKLGRLRGDVKTCVQYANYKQPGGGTVKRCALYAHGGVGRRYPQPSIRKQVGIKSKYRYRTPKPSDRFLQSKGRRTKTSSRKSPRKLPKRLYA